MIEDRVYFIETPDRIYLFIHNSQKIPCKHSGGKKITILPASLLAEIKNLLITTGDFIKGGIYIPENGIFI